MRIAIETAFWGLVFALLIVLHTTVASDSPAGLPFNVEPTTTLTEKP